MTEVILDFPPSGANATTASGVADLGTGYLRRVSVILLTGSAVTGRYWVRVFLLKSAAAAPANVAAIVWQGDVNDLIASFPNIALEYNRWFYADVTTGTNGVASATIRVVAQVDAKPAEGGMYLWNKPPGSGVPEVVTKTIATPGVGVNPAPQVVPAKVRWEWIGFSAQLVTVGAGTRIMKAVVTDGANDQCAGASGAGQIAGQTSDYYGIQGGPASTNASILAVECVPLPAGRWLPTFEFEIEVLGILAGDQVNPVTGSANIAFAVNEYVMPNPS